MDRKNKERIGIHHPVLRTGCVSGIRLGEEVVHVFERDEMYQTCHHATMEQKTDTGWIMVF